MQEIIRDNDLSVVCSKFIKSLQAASAEFTSSSFAIGLCGGRSIVPIAGALIGAHSSFENDFWSNAQFFVVDERIVDISSPESNIFHLQEAFFSPLLKKGIIDQSQVHVFDTEQSDLKNSLSAYEESLKNYGGRFAVAFLGVGEDGHVASLFPGASVEDESTESGLFQLVENSPKPPKKRMSSSFTLLQNSLINVGLFFGSGKQLALSRFLDSDGDLSSCPAKVIAKAQSHFVLTDILTS